MQQIFTEKETIHKNVGSEVTKEIGINVIPLAETPTHWTFFDTLGNLYSVSKVYDDGHTLRYENNGEWLVAGKLFKEES